MNAPSIPLAAQERRNHIISEIKSSFRLEEPFIHRMIADIFIPQAHESLWQDKFASACPNVRYWVIDHHVVKWFFPPKSKIGSFFATNYPAPAPSAETSPEYAAFYEAKLQERDGTFVVPDTAMWQQLRPQVSEGHPGVYGRFQIVLSRELSPANRIWHELESEGQQDTIANLGLVRVRMSLDVTQNAVVYQLGYMTKTPLTNPNVKLAVGQTWLNLVGWACEVLLLSHNPQLQPNYHVWLENHVVNGCPPQNESRLVEMADYARMVAKFKAALGAAELLLAGMALGDVTLQRVMTVCEKLSSGLSLPYSKLLVWAALYKNHDLDIYFLKDYAEQGLDVTREVLNDLVPKFLEWSGRRYVEQWIEENPLSLPHASGSLKKWVDKLWPA